MALKGDSFVPNLEANMAKQPLLNTPGINGTTWDVCCITAPQLADLAQTPEPTQVPTPAPTPPQPSVAQVSMLVKNVDYGLLEANNDMCIAFEGAVKDSLAAEARLHSDGASVSPDDVEVTLEPGSVNVHGIVHLPPEVDGPVVEEKLVQSPDLEGDVATKVSALPEIETYSTGPIDVIMHKRSNTALSGSLPPTPPAWWPFFGPGPHWLLLPVWLLGSSLGVCILVCRPFSRPGGGKRAQMLMRIEAEREPGPFAVRQAIPLHPAAPRLNAGGRPPPPAGTGGVPAPGWIPAE